MKDTTPMNTDTDTDTDTDDQGNEAPPKTTVQAFNDTVRDRMRNPRRPRPPWPTVDPTTKEAC
jgi:hypothetical protein